MTPFDDLANRPWVEAIGWGLVRSTWQGLAVAMALWLALRWLRRAVPGARYLAACLALAAMVVLPLATSGSPRTAASLGSRTQAVSPASAGPTPGQHFPAPETGRARLGLEGRLRPALPWAVVAWLAGVVVLSSRLLGGWALACRRKGRDVRALPTGWSDRLDRLRDRLGIGRAVDLFVSPGCEVPTVIGWVRPAILVPASALTGLSTAELESILAHELAHVRRHDYAINLLQCVAETLLFYHPCARWASRVIRQEREHCCDDLAVAACGDRLTYARALASMEGLRGPAFNLSPAANGGTLLARVRRVLNPKEEPMKPIKILGLLASMAIAPAWLAGVAAQQPDTPAPPLAPAAPTPTADVEAAKFAFDEIEIKGHRRLKVTPSEGAAREQGAATRQARPADGPSRKAIDDQGPPEDPVIALEPPTEAEIWEKIPKSRPEAPTFYEVHRDNARFLVEKIGTNVDPVKVYPLAGPCQLVHAHYKATVWFDETYRADHPIPFTHTRHRAEVVFIDKDFLIRAKGNQAVAPAEQPAEDVDRKIERLSREIEELRQSRRRERDERKRELDRLNNERVEPEGKPVR